VIGHVPGGVKGEFRDAKNAPEYVYELDNAGPV